MSGSPPQRSEPAPLPVSKRTEGSSSVASSPARGGGNRTSLLSSSISRDPSLLSARSLSDQAALRPPASPSPPPITANASASGSQSRKVSIRGGTPMMRGYGATDSTSQGDNLSRSLSRSIPVRAGTPSSMGFRGEDITDDQMAGAPVSGSFKPASYSRRSRPKGSSEFPAAFTPHDEPAPALQSFKQQLGSVKSRTSPRIPTGELYSSSFRSRDPTRRDSANQQTSLLSASIPRDALQQGLGIQVGPQQLKKVLDSHLVKPYELERRLTASGLVQEPGEDMEDFAPRAGPSSSFGGNAGSFSSRPIDVAAVHHHLAGGAIVDDIYKYVASSYQNSSQLAGSFVGAPPGSSFGGRATPQGLERSGTPSMPARRLSAPELPGDSIAPVVSPDGVTVRDMLAPGGMRRAFLLRRAQKEGTRAPQIHTRNFIEFLSLYGHFGMLDPDDQSDYGSEDEEYEEDDIPGVEWRIDELGHRRRRYQSGLKVVIDSGRNYYYEDAEGKILPTGFFEHDENEPLLLKKSASGDYGTSPSSTFFILLKAFVGTGILFLPKAFSNGGLVFSLLGMIAMGLISLFTMLILFWSSQSVGILGAGYGDVAEVLYGKWMRLFVLLSVVVSQIGFGTAYMIFIAQNVLNVIWTLATYCSTVELLILAQVAVYIPIVWIRKLGGFSFLSLVADVFILTGVAYVCIRDAQMIQREGPAWSDESGKGMHLWFGVSPPTFAGTAIFAYEGISLILPIANSMKNPDKFPLVLSLVMLVIGAMMILVGTLSYIAFGDKVTTVIFNAMPAGDPLAPLVQLLYALAIFFSFPLSVYPCIRITESWIFGTRAGKQNFQIKWLKNLFRAIFVICMGFIAIFGSNNLDYFVSLVGSVTCIPLMFILPAAFDLKLTQSTWFKIADALLLVFGTFAFFYITYRNILEWINAAGSAPPAPICSR